MRTSQLSALSVLFLAISAVTRPASGTPNDGTQILGSWQLMTLEEPQTNGRMNSAKCSGMLVLTADGHMSVQVMYVNPTDGPSQYSQGGYEASFGRYELEPRSHRLVYHVEGALVRALVGQRQERRYEISGDRLIITPTDPTEHWRVTWKRPLRTDGVT